MFIACLTIHRFLCQVNGVWVLKEEFLLHARIRKDELSLGGEISCFRGQQSIPIPKDKNTIHGIIQGKRMSSVCLFVLRFYGPVNS